MIFFETRKPENPKGLNPNPKVDFILNPNPIKPETCLANWNPIKPDPKSHARPQPEPEEFWTRPITIVYLNLSSSDLFLAFSWTIFGTVFLVYFQLINQGSCSQCQQYWGHRVHITGLWSYHHIIGWVNLSNLEKYSKKYENFFFWVFIN